MSFQPVSPIEVSIDDKSKEIMKASDNLDLAIQEQFRLKKALLEVSETVRKGRFLLARLKEERQSLEREFWRAKNA